MQYCGLEPNVVTYSIFIVSFCKACKLAKAASVFELMLLSKCIPNDVIFRYLVNGFANTVQFLRKAIGFRRMRSLCFWILFWKDDIRWMGTNNCGT
jgi:pentatricopeptide repeat protein